MFATPFDNRRAPLLFSACLLLGVGFACVAPAYAAPPAKKAAPKPAPVKAAPAAPSAKPVRLAPVWSVAFSPDGKRLAVGGYKRVTLYDVESGKRVAQWVASTDAVRSLSFSPDGKYLAAGGGAPGQSGTAVVFDTATGKTVRALAGHDDTVESVAFSGNLLLTAADDESIHVSDIATGKTLATLTEHVGRCLAVAVPSKTSDAAGGNIFFTGGADKMIKVWDAGMRRVVVNFDQAQSPVWSLASFVRPGRFVAGCGDGSIRLFGVGMAKEAPSPGEPQPRNGYQERAIGGAHEGGVYAVAPSSDDKYLVSGGADNAVKMWDLGGGLKKTLTDAHGAIWGVAVSPDAKKFAAASEDGTTRVYDAATGSLLLEMPLPPSLPTPPTPELGPVNTGTGLRASYFGNNALTGAPALVRVEAGVDSPRMWKTPNGAPDAKIGPENFSGRWEGYVEAPATGRYTFSTRSDDGVRLWVGGVSQVDNWTDHGPTDDVSTKTVLLTAGQRVAIKLEYYQGGGSGEIGLYWAYPGQDRQVIPVTRLYPAPLPGGPPAPKPTVSPTKKPVAPAVIPPGRMAKG